MPHTTANIGEKIKKIRELKGLTREVLADELDITVQGYAKIERGETDLSLTRLEQIANILKMDVYDIIGFDEKIIFQNVTNHNNGEKSQGIVVNQQPDWVSITGLLKELIQTIKGNKE